MIRAHPRWFRIFFPHSPFFYTTGAMCDEAVSVSPPVVSLFLFRSPSAGVVYCSSMASHDFSCFFVTLVFFRAFLAFAMTKFVLSLLSARDSQSHPPFIPNLRSLFLLPPLLFPPPRNPLFFFFPFSSVTPRRQRMSRLVDFALSFYAAAARVFAMRFYFCLRRSLILHFPSPFLVPFSLAMHLPY